MKSAMPNAQDKLSRLPNLKGRTTTFLTCLSLLTLLPIVNTPAATLPVDQAVTSTNRLDTPTTEEPERLEDMVQIQPLELAQVGEETVSLFETQTYAVRIIRRPGGALFMNAFNRNTGIQEQNGVPTRVLSITNEITTYASDGSQGGLPATYIARVATNGVGELQIINSNGSVVFLESSQVAGLGETPTTPTEQENTIARFEGPEFATHVLEKGGGLFMNVHDRRADVTILNGQRVFVEAPRNEQDEWRSYLSFGEFRGVPATFNARVSPRGQTQLEIINRNTGQLLAREDSTLIAGQATNLLTNNYVVAIPGGSDMLARVRQFYPEAYLDRSRRGDFVNAGSFANRRAAFARTYSLQSEGIDARVVYRLISYN